MSINNYYGPEDDYDNEMDLLREELMGDNDSSERSNDEGWYYDDED
jgi:hypothetical protein